MRAWLIARIEQPEVIARNLARIERTVPEQHQRERPCGVRAASVPLLL